MDEYIILMAETSEYILFNYKSQSLWNLYERLNTYRKKEKHCSQDTWRAQLVKNDCKLDIWWMFKDKILYVDEMKRL